MVAEPLGTRWRGRGVGKSQCAGLRLARVRLWAPDEGQEIQGGIRRRIPGADRFSTRSVLMFFRNKTKNSTQDPSCVPASSLPDPPQGVPPRSRVQGTPARIASNWQHRSLTTPVTVPHLLPCPSRAPKPREKQQRNYVGR